MKTIMNKKLLVGLSFFIYHSSFSHAVAQTRDAAPSARNQPPFCRKGTTFLRVCSHLSPPAVRAKERGFWSKEFRR